MLGFDAIGRLALGQIPGTSVTSIFLTAKITSKAALRVTNNQISALQARIGASSFAKAQASPNAALSAKAKMQMAARAPGGLILNARISAMAKARATPGYLLFARMMMSSSASSVLHIEGTTTAARLPLLLNSSSQFGASYWKGRS